MATPKLSAIRNPTLCIPLAIDRGGLSPPNKQDDSAGPLVAGFPATLGRIARQREEKNENPSSFCPVCSARLEAHKCKLRCPTCGYYMSCSDYY